MDVRYVEALNALKKQAAAVFNNGTFEPDKDLLAEAQAEMDKLEPQVKDICNFLTYDKNGITIEIADLKWLEENVSKLTLNA